MAAWKAIPSSSSSSSGPRSPDPISVALQQWPRPSSSLSPPKSLPTSPPLQPAGSGSSVDSYGATLYKTELCRSFADTGYCRYGLKCRFAHGSVDLRPVTRHKKYKTERCKNYVKDGSCPYGPRCRFVHEPDEALQLIEDTGSPPSPDIGPSSPGDDGGSPPLRSSGSVGIAMGRQLPSSSPGHAVIGTPGRSPVFGGHIAAGSPYLSGGLGGLAVPPVLNLSGSAAASSSIADRALLSPHAAAAQSQAANERRGRALSDLPANGTNGGSIYGRYEDNGRVMPPSGSSAGRAVPRAGDRDRDGSLFATVFNPQPVNTVFGFDPTPSPSSSSVGQQSLLAGTYALPRSPSPPPLPSPSNTGPANGGSGMAISYHHHDVQMSGVGARGVFASHASSHHYSALTTQLHSRDEVLFTQTTSMAHPIPMRAHHRGPQEHHGHHGGGHGHGHHVGHPDMISREPSVVSEDGMERLGQDLGRVLDGASPVAGNPNNNNGNGNGNNNNEESPVVAPAPRRAAPRVYMGVSSSLPLALEAQGHVPPQPRFGNTNTSGGVLGAPSTWPSLSSASVPSTPATGPRVAPSGVAGRPVYLGTNGNGNGNGNGAPDSLASALRRQLHVSNRQVGGGDDNSANEDDINNDSSSVHDHDDDITSASPDHDDDSNNDRNHNGSNTNGKSRHQQLFVSKPVPSSVKQASMNIRPL